MNNKRQVDFGVLLNLLKGKGRLPVIGLIFVCVSVFIIFPITFTISATLKQPYEKYNFNDINKNGTEKDAKITFIKSVNNVNINGEHPRIVSYEYENNGQQVSDKFETFDLEKITNLTIGTKVKILTYQGQSTIKGLSPFAFPFYLFYILPMVFLILGGVFLLIGLLPALKLFNLYKSGIIKEAYVVSMSPRTGLFSLSGFQQNVLVSYFFYDEFGGKVFGESLTNDFLILSEKKAGDPIKIFVSETDETISCMVPKLEAMKNKWDLQLN